MFRNVSASHLSMRSVGAAGSGGGAGAGAGSSGVVGADGGVVLQSSYSAAAYNSDSSNGAQPRQFRSRRSGAADAKPAARAAGRPQPPSLQQQNAFLRSCALYRSEPMARVRLYFDRVAAHDTIEELGVLGALQFEDLNASQSAFQRSFTSDLKACEEIQRALRFLRAQIESTPGVQINSAVALDLASEVRLDDLAQHISALELGLIEMNSHWDALKVQMNALVEFLAVFEQCSSFFGSSSIRMLLADSNRSTSAALNFDALLSSSALDGAAVASLTRPKEGFSSLQLITGVIQRDRVASFERILFRATRGNCLLRMFDEVQITTARKNGSNGSDEPVPKSVFIVLFSSLEIKLKVTKICEAFAASRYPFPEDGSERERALQESTTRLGDLKAVIASTEKQRRDMLVDIGFNLMLWEHKADREKAIFHVLNLLNYESSTKLFIAEGWATRASIPAIQEALERARRRSNAQLPSVFEEKGKVSTVDHDFHSHDAASASPPTFFKTNKFTQVFQGIVEAYGVAEYQEVNPAVFTVITFPFLFAVMFGDIGHGLLMAAFAVYLIRNERDLEQRRARLGEFVGTCYDGRYVILLMGVFSIYTGFIYNEFFAFPLELFGRSTWKYTESSIMACGVDNCADAAAAAPPLQTYAFGFDPIWKHARTGLLFFNSYKMKLSIVLGVCQMALGLCLSLENARFFRKPLDIWYGFVPQMLFLMSIFGYLVLLIVLKWLTDWNSASCRMSSICEAPDIKNILIGMFMSPGRVPAKNQLFPGQAAVQLLLFIVALISVPWMLLPKPLILRARYSSQLRLGYKKLESDDQETPGESGGAAAHDSCEHTGGFNFGDVMVHQMIHTIEFVLGAISNTASYLRLWALSLAHAQLSDVFAEKLLIASWRSGNVILIAIGFSMWLALTLGVLMMMESLSAFLHALRLHWVEFQNKFYNLNGGGKKFSPLDLSPSINY
ncbi:V-type proton ATPase subunit a2 [Porphyridium purpureum]|uniref:V-type proton ATPase subunit a n=1 Tax=Porphyridium purpureum TaxID=35688 RepID=A0A5J4YSF4_PORPP|nr:V-type proton ATPase subunit a2 [Porphyridium purpureum]|eukprot:POR8744..scf229_5